MDDASGRRWTGAQMRERMLNIATAFTDHFDFKKGTMVCISSDHSDYSCLLALGIICAGGVVTCAFPLDPYPEILYLAQKVEPKFFFCDEKNLYIAKKLEQDLGYQVTGCIMDNKPDDGNNASDSFTHFMHFLNYDHRQSKNLDNMPVAFDDLSKELCFIMMSSGTTGKPKAVPVTHKKCIEDTTFSRARNNRGLTFACPSSLDYVSGRLVFLGAIGTGYTAIILNGFEPKSFLSAVERHKISFIYLGAAAFYRLITYEHLEDYDISSVRMVFPMGAKIVYLDELRDFFNRHPHIIQVKQGYGTSEFCGGAMNSMKPADYLLDCENCGTLLQGNKAKIVDTETGKLLGPNQTGMLHFWSRNQFLGYYDVQLSKKRAKEQKESCDYKDEQSNVICSGPFLRDSSTFDEDGFYITGDLAYFNEKEELFVVGRQKELMFCRGAKKVLPQELEEVIEQHEVVSKVCVLGIPNKRELTLHCPRAFIIPKAIYYNNECQLEFAKSKQSKEPHMKQPDELLEHKGNHTMCKMDTSIRRLIAEDIMEFVNARVGYEKQLTGGIVLLDSLPNMRANGKMDKTFLRSLNADKVEIYGDRSG